MTETLHITPRQTLEIRLTHARTKRDAHPRQANESFYQLIDRRSNAPIHDHGRDPNEGRAWITATWNMQPSMGHPITPQTLTLDIPLTLYRDLTAHPPDAAAHQDRGHPDSVIVADESLWPHWPWLDLDRPGWHDRSGGWQRGWITSGERPRDAGMNIRVRRRAADDYLYPDPISMLADGWRPRY